MLESKKREVLKIKKSLRYVLANQLGQKLCVESVHRVMRPGLLVHLTFAKIQNVSALAANNLHKRLRLVVGTPEWVKDWITRILNANQYLLDLLTSAVSAFCLGWSIASDTFSSLFQTHIFKFISYLPNYFLNIHPTCRDKRQWGGKEPDWTTSGPSPSVWYFQ